MGDKKPGYIQFSIDEQLARLGLSEHFLEFSRGARFLDVGCGIDANLVRYLRGRGIEAEGIDPALRESNDYLMKLSISALFPNPGCIPRPDNYYDVVVSNGNGTIRVLTDYNETDFFQIRREINSADQLETRLLAEELLQQNIAEVHQQAVNSLSEMVRVVQPGGMVICHPGITRLRIGELVNPKGFVMYQTSSSMKESLIALLEGEKYDSILKLIRELNPKLINSKFYTTVFAASAGRVDQEPPEEFMKKLKEELIRRGIPIPDYDRRVYKKYMRERLYHAASMQEQEVLEPPENKARRFTRLGEKVGRNNPCPCGSGKKYKRCCG